MTQSKFDLGRVVATPTALAAVREAGQAAGDLLARHRAGDWGDVEADDARVNDTALLDGSRLLSAYRLRTGITVWVVTEGAGADGRRASTSLLLPSEY